MKKPIQIYKNLDFERFDVMKVSVSLKADKKTSNLQHYQAKQIFKENETTISILYYIHVNMRYVYVCVCVSTIILLKLLNR